MTGQATVGAADSAPHVTQPGLGRVPRRHYREKTLFSGGHAMSYAILRLSAPQTSAEYQQFAWTEGSLCLLTINNDKTTHFPPLQQEKRGFI